MNKNVTKAIFLGVLGVVLVYFLYTRVFSESEEERAFRENLARQQQARQSGEAPAAPAGAPAAGPAAAAAAPGGAAVIREDEIDLEELAAGIKEVEFDYDESRKEEQLRNPMAPLVGPYVAATVPGAAVTEGGQPGTADDEAVINAIQRNLLLTGIMWHPTAPVAIINNEVIPPGYQFPNEMFRTARSTSGVLEDAVSVERMTRNSVILKYKNSEITLELKER